MESCELLLSECEDPADWEEGPASPSPRAGAETGYKALPAELSFQV